MKKKLLSWVIIAGYGIMPLFGQKIGIKPNLITPPNSAIPSAIERCSTSDPGLEWKEWFNGKVEEYKAQQASLKSQGLESVVNYTIPVIVHVVHAGEAIGTGSNVSAAQVQDQINILNADYAGTGLNSSSVPSAFSALKANCNITFCLALKDANGNTLAEPGIHRVQATSISGITSIPTNGFPKATIDGTIKPATIWDPTKYCNMWVLNLQSNLLGYATFPAAAGLTGLGGAPLGTATTDGLVVRYTCFGSIGSAAGGAPYNKGRTATHEIGHWLGLLHIWGDNGQCGASDYCVDTPPQMGGTINPPGSNYGCPTYPFQANTCTRPDGAGGANVTNTNGDMFMNFMDYTDDACMYMFTNDQRTRAQTAMANGTYRSNLNNSSAIVCNSTPVAPIAGFTYGTTVCTGSATLFTSTSTGSPTSYNWSVSPGAGVTIASPTAANTNITFTNPGNYTVTLTATNAQGSDNDVQTIVAQSCAGLCDTITNYGPGSTATLNLSAGWGWYAGHNSYSDKAKADIYSSYTAGFQLTGGIFYFAKGYDGGTPGNITITAWDDNGAGGAPNTSLGTKTLAISSINTTGPGNTVLFATPISVTGPFYLGIDGLVYGTGQDSIALYTNADGQTTPGTAWEKWSNNAWYPFSDATNSWGVSVAHAIFPIMCSPTTGEIEIVNNTSEVIVFPNPASNNVAVSVNFKKEDNLTIRIFNSIGQIVTSKQVNNTHGGTFNLDIAGLSGGIYYVNVVSSQKAVTKRLVIEK